MSSGRATLKTTGWRGDHPSVIPKHDLGGEETIARLYLVGAEQEFRRLATRHPGNEEIARSLTSDQGYTEFLLQSASEPLQESVQVSRSLRGNYVAFSFGQNPPTWSYTAALFNTRTDDWRIRFFVAYSRYLRAGALTQLGRKVLLTYDDLRVHGSLLNMGSNLTADLQAAGQVNFSILVSRVEAAYETLYAEGDRGINPLLIDAEPIRAEAESVDLIAGGST